MKLSVIVSTAVLLSSAYAATQDANPFVEPIHPRYTVTQLIPYSLNVESPEFLPRDSTTCSIGIGREMNSLNWDVTVYNVPQPERQDWNIMGTLKYAFMDKGDSITVKGLAQDITITNVDNAPVFNYDIPALKAPLDTTGAFTKVKLNFQMGDVKWDTSACGADNVAFTAGRESWSCNFACPSSTGKEL